MADNPYLKYVQPQGNVFTLPQSPLQSAQTDRTRSEIGNDQARLALARQAEQRAQQAEIRAQQAQQIQMQQNQREQAAKLAPLNAMDKQLHRVWDLYAQGPGKTKGLAGVLDYLPTEQNAAVDAASAGLGELGRNAFRTPGMGSQSDTELKAFIAANQPSTSNYDSGFEEKLSNLETRLGAQFQAAGKPYTPYRPPSMSGLSPEAARAALAKGEQTFARLVAGASPQDRKRTMDAFNSDPRIQQLRAIINAPPPRKKQAGGAKFLGFEGQ